MPNVPDPWTAEAFRCAVAAAAAGADGEARLLDLLDEAHAAYAQCSSQEVARRRGWIFAQLARRPLTTVASPFIAETLHTAHEPYLLAAASRALTRLPRPDAMLGPAVLRAVDALVSRDDFIDMAQWGGVTDDESGPTALTEAMNALMWQSPGGGLDDSILEGLLTGRGMAPEHRVAIEHMLESQAEPDDDSAGCCTPVAPSRLRDGGSAADMRSVRLQDQDGLESGWPGLFTGKPCVVAFFYTRCDNPLKCSLTVTKLARLQELLASEGLDDAVRIAAISYDSDFDRPERLRDYARMRQLRLDERARMLRVVEGAEEVRRHFACGVSFVGTLVNWHRVEVFLLDSTGKPAVSYERRAWDPGEIVDDLRALVAEEANAAPASKPGRVAGVTPALWAFFFAILPKCPICGATYLSVTGIAALPLLDGWVMLWPLALVLLGTNVLLLARTALRGGPLSPVVAAGTGALLIAGPGLAFGSAPATFWGFVLCALGSVLSVLRFSRGQNKETSNVGRSIGTPGRQCWRNW